jgi:hypothetical protein
MLGCVVHGAAGEPDQTSYGRAVDNGAALLLSHLARGKFYRERAEECRTLAETFEVPELREQMQKTAADYERMALALDRSRDLMDAAELRNLR